MNQHRVKEGVSLLKQNGIRMTPQRMAIMDYLANAESHPTADDIFNSLTHKLPFMTNATVYNALKCFKKYGIVNELIFGRASSRYEWATSFHYHVVCTSCGKIRDFDYPKLVDVERFAERKTGYTITQHFFEAYGTCPDCNKT
ncbi:Fur family peroxide stress response transcriptional regulator [Scopulibacillus darangshiensis]|uniref:Fur family peroxide stress response transcriptional regulator n=1 Tax=Scopulibacillus darangshiensis TaxID=442528 RepID=A0A4R2NZM9_9BACL|nr:Fur family transcriptional regulator [Scopulibacillus darangshiensis]TCP27779.1 Fur family peroxide stress response transcriptional regulator [Scopulibacillus darangshiensis]